MRVRSSRVEDTRRRGKICPCCARVSWKCKLLDKISIKETLEEISLAKSEIE